MKLPDLAFACFVYGRLSENDTSYQRFLAATTYSPDLRVDAHRKYLLTWLNEWGCRQFAKNYHNLASKNILSWYNQFSDRLPSEETNLWQLDEDQLIKIGAAFESLSDRTASYRTRGAKRYRVSVGSTGAAKILFAIRPKALVPWDEFIRHSLNFDKPRQSYPDFLRMAKQELTTLETSCRMCGFQLADLPVQVSRPNSTVPKLIDEYYWVTLSEGLAPPDPEMLRRWASWA